MHDPNPRLENALFEAIARLGADSGTIHMKDPDRDVLLLAAHHHIPENLLEHIQEIPWGKGLAGIAAERAEPVHHGNIKLSSAPEIHTRARGCDVRGAIVVPILSGSDPVGTLGVGCNTDHTFTRHEIQWLMNFARSLASEWGETRMAA
jgi:putative methionine-R-sulfoxide reductase with GAF domain